MGAHISTSAEAGGPDRLGNRGRLRAGAELCHQEPPWSSKAADYIEGYAKMVEIPVYELAIDLRLLWADKVAVPGKDEPKDILDGAAAAPVHSDFGLDMVMERPKPGTFV